MHSAVYTIPLLLYCSNPFVWISMGFSTLFKNDDDNKKYLLAARFIDGGLWKYCCILIIYTYVDNVNVHSIMIKMRIFAVARLIFVSCHKLLSTGPNYIDRYFRNAQFKNLYILVLSSWGWVMWHFQNASFNISVYVDEMSLQFANNWIRIILKKCTLHWEKKKPKFTWLTHFDFQSTIQNFGTAAQR